MKWKNANRDELPKHDQDVLISVDGVYYIAFFDEGVKAFRIRNQMGLIFEIGGTDAIYWMNFESPPQERTGY
jgi:hypothetical protein